ncbi:MAG: universal stress protein [Nitrospira sp.]|nr:universal stress protein [Nitrospira sp.]
MPRSRKAAPCILLPTDFQQPARRAFNYGLALARLLGLRLELLHVIKTPSDGPGLRPDTRYARALRTSALLELGRLARIAKEAGVQAEPLLDFGVPDECILRRMEQKPVDVLVTGTEGRTGWDRLRLGSTAHTLVRRANCPVLAVHGGVAGDVVRHTATVRFARMLLATDFSACADEALHAVSRLAALAGAGVRVVHVHSTEDGKPHMQQKMDRVIQALRDRGIEADGTCRPGNPVEAILEEASRWEADLVAVGTQGRRGLSRLLLGSVAEGVLRRAGCPVLVVRFAATLLNRENQSGRGRRS